MSEKQGEAKRKLCEFLKQTVCATGYPEYINGFKVNIGDCDDEKEVTLTKDTGSSQTITIQFALNKKEHLVPAGGDNSEINEITPKPFRFAIEIKREIKDQPNEDLSQILECLYYGTHKANKCNSVYSINKIRLRTEQWKWEEIPSQLKILTLKKLMVDYLTENDVTDELFKKVYKYAISYNKADYNIIKGLHDVFF